MDVSAVRFGAPRDWRAMKFANIKEPCRWQLPVAEVLYGIRDEPGEKPSLELGAGPEAEAFLSRLDDHIQSTVMRASVVWFEREATEEVVRATHFRALRDNQSYRVKLCWAGKWTDSRLWVYRGDEDGCERGEPRLCDDWSRVAPGRRVLPVVRPSALWFSNKQFGLSLQATDLLLVPPWMEEGALPPG